MTRKIAVATVALLTVLAPAASARETFKRIAGVKSAGTPAKYNKVGILKIGSARAKNILVLNPGTSASAAYFAPLARDLTSKAPGWQVWAVERRENLLEDHSVFNRLKRGAATPQQSFDYYLGYLANPRISPRFRSIPDSSVAYARQWGMRTGVGDLRRVVASAKRAAGRRGKVVMGGHSLGGTITIAYATWSFGGKPGARGLSGLVLIDGASRTEAVSVAAARESVAKLRAGSPWLTFGGIPAPFTGLFNTGGSLNALRAPNAPSLTQNFPLLPSNLKPPVPATNLGQYGYALDTQTSPPSLAAAQGHIGSLAPTGSPRGWVQGRDISPIRRFAQMFAGDRFQSLDGTAWYHPQRLSIDAGAVGNGIANPAQKVLGVRSTRGRALPRDLRIYAFGAALGGKRVPAAARALARQSKIPSAQPAPGRAAVDLLPQRPELRLSQEQVRRRPGAVPEGHPEAALMLRPLPDGFAATRLAMHRVAEDRMKPAREAVTGRFGLRATPGGFGTPPFGEVEEWHVDGVELIVRRGASDIERAPIEGVAPDAAAALADWFAFGWGVLEELRAEAADAELTPSAVQLWPEHFDVGVDFASVNYGASPGDEAHAEPYLYVGPWEAPPEGPLWNAQGFPGAELAYAELLEADDRRAAALEFFRSRRDALQSS